MSLTHLGQNHLIFTLSVKSSTESDQFHLSLIWCFSPSRHQPLGPHLSLAGLLTTMLSSHWAMVLSCKISPLHCQPSPIICQILEQLPLLAWSFSSPWRELSLCYLWDSRVLICDFSMHGILCSWCLFLYYLSFQLDHMLLKDRNAFFSLCPSEFVIHCVIYYKPDISGVEQTDHSSNTLKFTAAFSVGMAQ